MTIDQNRLALAAIAACSIRALGASDPSFIRRFKAYLWHADDLLRRDAHQHFGALETVAWVRELIDCLPESPPREMRQGPANAAE